MESSSDENQATPTLNSPEEEINLYFTLKKTIAMKVKKTEKIEKLKLRIHAKVEEEILEDLPELFYAGQQLENGLTVMDYGIPNNSVIHNDSGVMKLYFKTPSNEKTFELKANRSDTIENIKFIIEVREGIPVHEYDIYYGGKLIESYITLDVLNINNEDTLQMISVPKELQEIFVQTPTSTVKLEVRRAHTVLDVKKMVESMRICIPSEDCELFRGGEQLQNLKTLAYYDIKENEVLQIIRHVKHSIFVKLLNGRYIILEVAKFDTVRDVKDKLFREIGQAPDSQRLVFKRQQLEDDRNLASYKIVNESIVNLTDLGM